MQIIRPWTQFSKKITDSMYFTNWGAAVSGAPWLICYNGMPQNTKYVATEVLVFDFEIFIGNRYIGS
jgi:hypothetical protein